MIQVDKPGVNRRRALKPISRLTTNVVAVHRNRRGQIGGKANHMADNPRSWLRRRVHILLRALGGEYSRLGDFVEDQDRYEVTSPESLEAQIDGVLGTLTEREAQAITLRFGLDDGRSKTLNEAGTVMGVTGERVRQLEAVALRKLREHTRLALLPRASR